MNASAAQLCKAPASVFFLNNHGAFDELPSEVHNDPGFGRRIPGGLAKPLHRGPA